MLMIPFPLKVMKFSLPYSEKRPRSIRSICRNSAGETICPFDETAVRRNARAARGALRSATRLLKVHVDESAVVRSACCYHDVIDRGRQVMKESLEGSRIHGVE